MRWVIAQSNSPSIANVETPGADKMPAPVSFFMRSPSASWLSGVAARGGITFLLILAVASADNETRECGPRVKG